MGLFGGKQGENGLFIQFPDSSVVGSQADMDRLMSDYSFTPSTISKWRLEQQDIDAIASASAKLSALALNDESIISFGPVQLNGFPKSHNEYIADAILTPDLLIVYYQKSLLIPDYLILPLHNLSGLSSTGPWSAQFNFRNGIHREKKGVFEMAETYFELSERLGKDGHANRRSVTFMRSLANTLKEVHTN
jgi:hypothetical protein